MTGDDAEGREGDGSPPRDGAALAVGAVLFNMMSTPALTVDAIILHQQKIVLIKRKNPPFKGSYALPGGFVDVGETVEDAMLREAKEETSLDVRVERFLGLIEYEFRCQGSTLPFVSYIFRLEELGGELCCLDDGEAITGFREASVEELPTVAAHLEQLEPEWHDWGNFRAIAHNMVREMLAG